MGLILSLPWCGEPIARTGVPSGRRSYHVGDRPGRSYDPFRSPEGAVPEPSSRFRYEPRWITIYRYNPRAFARGGTADSGAELAVGVREVGGRRRDHLTARGLASRFVQHRADLDVHVRQPDGRCFLLVFQARLDSDLFLVRDFR